MKVLQIRMKVYLLKDIPVEDVRKQITYFLDGSMAQDEVLSDLHKENKYKFYTYDLLYPCEQDKKYKKGKIYTITIRTIDEKLARHFMEVSVHFYTEFMKGLISEVSIIPKKQIDMLYTLTPAILKAEEGYWRGKLSVEDFEERLRVNLIKKWNVFHQEKMDEEFDFLTGIEFMNKCPISVPFKNVKLLGDKICIHVADNPSAQMLAYMSLGTGILEMNARGFGFVNYRWI